MASVRQLFFYLSQHKDLKKSHTCPLSLYSSIPQTHQQLHASIVATMLLNDCGPRNNDIYIHLCRKCSNLRILWKGRAELHESSLLKYMTMHVWSALWWKMASVDQCEEFLAFCRQMYSSDIMVKVYAATVKRWWRASSTEVVLGLGPNHYVYRLGPPNYSTQVVC